MEAGTSSGGAAGLESTPVEHISVLFSKFAKRLDSIYGFSVLCVKLLGMCFFL